MMPIEKQTLFEVGVGTRSKLRRVVGREKHRARERARQTDREGWRETPASTVNT